MLPANQNFKKFGPTTQQFLYSYIQSKSEVSMTTVAKVRLSQTSMVIKLDKKVLLLPYHTTPALCRRRALTIRAQKDSKKSRALKSS